MYLLEIAGECFLYRDAENALEHFFSAVKDAVVAEKKMPEPEISLWNSDLTESDREPFLEYKERLARKLWERFNYVSLRIGNDSNNRYRMSPIWIEEDKNV